MTTIATIVKANATVITTTSGIVATSTSKGVPGQFDKLIDLINQLPQEEVIVEAEKIKGVFKALNENSKDSTTFKFVIACKGWELVQVEKDVWFICRPEGDIVLINGSYIEPTQPEEVKMEIEDSFNFKELPFKEQSDINCLLLSIGGKTFPQSLNDIEDSISKVAFNEDEKTQLAIRELEAFVNEYRPSQIRETVKTCPVTVYLEVSVETDQGLKIAKYLATDTGIITCKGTEFESIEALVNAVKAAFKVEAVVVSETTQQEPEEVAMEQSKPKTFCQLLKDVWLPKQEGWVVGELKERGRQAWKANKERTSPAQAEFMKKFYENISVYGDNTLLPTHVLIGTYDYVRSEMLGTFEAKKQEQALNTLVSVGVDKEVVKDAVEFHFNNLLQQFKPKEVLNEIIQKGETLLKQTQEVSDEEYEELSEGKVTIKTMLGDVYTVEVFYNKSKTLWINARSGESFNSLFDLCMVHDKEYFNHEFFTEGQPSTDTIAPQYQLGDILAVTYDDEHNEYAYYGGDLITVKAVVVQNGFQLGEGEDAEVFATIHELCCKTSDGNYEGTPEVRVVTEEEIESILEKEYNLGMGIE